MTEKTAVLLVNLGSPETLSTTAIRRFYAKFLSDPDVVDLPRYLWWPILYAFILPFRPQKSLKNYAAIWGKEGSPLLSHTKHLAERLSQALDLSVYAAMSYSEPSLEKALKALEEKALDKIIVLPLYPQYSHTTTGSVLKKINSTIKQWQHKPTLCFIEHYASHPAYIQAIAESIIHHQKTNTQSSCLVFSFHGLPQAMIEKGDPYFNQCQATTRALMTQLSLTKESSRLVFQSRFGRAQWLQPYCDETLKTLPQEHKNICVICPGFPVDCLETLYEIDIENREYFLKAGGENFHYIPALNASNGHVQALSEIIKTSLENENSPY